MMCGGPSIMEQQSLVQSMTPSILEVDRREHVGRLAAVYVFQQRISRPRLLCVIKKEMHSSIDIMVPILDLGGTHWGKGDLYYSTNMVLLPMVYMWTSKHQSRARCEVSGLNAQSLEESLRYWYLQLT